MDSRSLPSLLILVMLMFCVHLVILSTTNRSSLDWQTLAMAGGTVRHVRRYRTVQHNTNYRLSRTTCWVGSLRPSASEVLNIIQCKIFMNLLWNPRKVSWNCQIFARSSHNRQNNGNFLKSVICLQKNAPDPRDLEIYTKLYKNSIVWLDQWIQWMIYCMEVLLSQIKLGDKNKYIVS